MRYRKKLKAGGEKIKGGFNIQGYLHSLQVSKASNFKPQSVSIYLNICAFSLLCTPDGYEKQKAHSLAE